MCIRDRDFSHRRSVDPELGGAGAEFGLAPPPVDVHLGITSAAVAVHLQPENARIEIHIGADVGRQ
eukprot:1086295-Pyramimonas_sp.AAC.1